MKENLKILFSQDSMLQRDDKTLCRMRFVVSLVLCIAATLMLVMNLKNHSDTMTKASIILVAGFLLSCLAAGVLKKPRISAIIIALLVGFVLSVFALTGGNEGFAILWILLVPLFAINILGVAAGLTISTYFLIFLFVLFHTGAKVYIADKYSASFIGRFPVLYLSDYLIATFFSLQRELYHRQLKMQAYSDGLTGAYNRRFFMEQLQNMDAANETAYALVALDLNGLKSVNDSLGHEAGDEMIQGIVECCKEAFDKTDFVCRTGGDEYVVIALGDQNAITKKLEKLQKCKEKWTGKKVQKISFAVGCAYKEVGVSYEELMKMADTEMYKDKTLYYQDARNNRRKR